MSSLRKTDTIRKTIFLSEESVKWVNQQSTQENRTFSNMVDTLILRQIGSAEPQRKEVCQ